MKTENRLLLFTRYPVPGQAKTRLIPALGPTGAARLHRRLAEYAAGVARTTGALVNARVTVCFTGAPLRDLRSWLGPDLAYTPQPAGDLGFRLQQAFASAFRSAARRVVAFGSDVPDLTAALLHQAFARLQETDVVLGPAADGGYYLIGMKRDRPELFAGIDWGTGRVRAQTRAAIGRQGLSATELPTLSDVDLPEDAAALRFDPRFADVWTGKPLLSVIIPTLNEAVSLGPTLERVRRADGIEIILADGGSRDATREIAARTGATVLVTAGGRAAQQNEAAAVARGRHLLFLHADTLLPDGYADLIRHALDRPATAAGAFRFRTDGSGAAMRLVEWGANVRSTVLRWPYGDQGLFMEKRVFDEVGGFSPLPIMEDYELVRRLRRRGPVLTLSEPAITSARRWRRLGALRTTGLNLAMIAGFRAGVPPERLARFYRGGRNAAPKAP
ncbi:MAG: TIGR04283 family arsenosugar biosynthesis glycosyltransferase [Candidatus Methylomirabilia bacterium]